MSQGKKKTNEEFIDELSKINPNIKILEEYKGSKTKILCKCLICGNIWESKPNSLLCKHGCPECGNRHRIKANTKTHKQFVEELTKINPNIKVLDMYKQSQDKILCECLICHNQWDVKPMIYLMVIVAQCVNRQKVN